MNTTVCETYPNSYFTGLKSSFTKARLRYIYKADLIDLVNAAVFYNKYKKKVLSKCSLEVPDHNREHFIVRLASKPLLA